jgi:transmembrane sensor
MSSRRSIPVLFVNLLLTVLFLGNLRCKDPGGVPAGAAEKDAARDPERDSAYENNTERPRTVGLPDGSRVLMGAHTLLLLSKAFDQTKRELDLDGEAVFDIVPVAGKPFIIHTRLLEIEVLGTRLRVDAHRENAGEEVDLLKGRLRVRKSYHSDTDNEPETLETGEMVMINRDIDLMEKEKLDSADWKRMKEMH